jgi:lysosomal acid lipase/cholesteryl ester hydrolase
MFRFDVYLANCRGTVYSVKHVKLNIYSKEFWQFGMDEVQFDMMAYLEYITEQTNKKVHVFGVSQGAAGIFAGLADPHKKRAFKMASMIEKFHAFAPVMFTVSSKQFLTLP